MSDPRFSRLKTDPRFRRPKRKEAKVVVDDRFKSVFDDGKKSKKGKGKRVDKYGRPVSDTHEQDNLRKFYRLENEDEEQDTTAKSVVDYARGEALMESSDEDDNKDEPEEDGESDDGGIVTLGAERTKPIRIPRDEDADAEIDLDEDNFADLDAEAAAAQAAQEAEEEATSHVTPTRRLAVVNLDWDHVKASHLYKIFSSLVSPTASSLGSAPIVSARSKSNGAVSTSTAIARGRVLSVRVYSSQFGKERMAREETEGPPAEVFRKRARVEEDEDAEDIIEVGEEEEVDEDALRKYQLERMRYYYAIAEFDSVPSASHVYTELEGTELERSANVFDLSYVPDEMTFDDQPRDDATEDNSTSYQGLDFVTDALRHSKVKLTWDEDDPERNRVTRRALSKKEIEEADFKALIASDSDGSDAEVPASGQGAGKKDQKMAQRDRLRALLLEGENDAVPEGWGGGFEAKTDADDVDMEITFMPALSEAKTGEETTLERYQRKMKDKRKKRKDEVKERVKGEEEGGGKAKGKSKPVGDDFFESDEGRDKEERPTKKGKDSKGKKGAGRSPSPEPGGRTVSTAEELALLATSDRPDGEPKHFDMSAIVKAEKKKGKKQKKQKGREDDVEKDEMQEDFAIDVKDDRFTALHEDHTFAIDPSNPHFKKTKSMAALLDERSKRRKREDTVHVPKAERKRSAVAVTQADGDSSLRKLVESVKRKSTGSTFDSQGAGKRRKA